MLPVIVGDVVLLRNSEESVSPEYVPAFVTEVVNSTTLSLTYFFPGQSPQNNEFTQGPGLGQWQPLPVAGSYTPTITGVENVAGATAAQSFWVRRGNIVHVHGSVNIQPSGAGTTSFRLSLPVPSNLTTATDLAGHGLGTSFSGASGTDMAEGAFTATSGGTVTISYSFAYEVK